MSFGIAKETINKMKRQLIKWEKVFLNHMSDELVWKKYIRNSYNSLVKNSKQYALKMGRGSK